MSIPPRLPVLAATLALLILTGCAPKPVTLNLSPALKVGQKFTYTADLSQESKQDMTTAAPGLPAQPPQSQDLKSTVDLEGEAEVLAVNANGGAQKIAFTVKSLAATKDGNPVSGLPGAGAKIIAERKGNDVTLTIDGKPSSNEITATLGDALPLDDDKHTDQEMNGPTKPVAVGDTWPMNAAAMMDDFKLLMDADIADLKGEMKLDALTGSGDDQVASVSGSFSAKMKPSNLPSVVTVDVSSMTGTLTGDFPATTTKGRLTQTGTLTIKLDVHGEQQGVQVKMSMTNDQKRTASATFH